MILTDTKLLLSVRLQLPGLHEKLPISRKLGRRVGRHGLADGWRSTAHSWRSGQVRRLTVHGLWSKQVRRLTAYSFRRSRGNGRYADSFRRSLLRWVAVCIV